MFHRPEVMPFFVRSPAVPAVTAPIQKQYEASWSQGECRLGDTVWPTGQYTVVGVSYLLRIIIIGSSTLGLSRPMRPESTGGNGTDPVASETQDAGCKRRSHRQCYSGAIHGCFGECQSLLRQPATSNVRPGSIMTSAVEVLPPAPIIV